MINEVISNLPPRYVHSGDSDSGGFSDVYFCYDEHLKRNIVIKTIKDISELDRLKDEISALLQLRSKHVVQVFDIVKSAETSFGIVMEHIDGLDLFETEEHTKSDTQLLKVLWQIASGISDIHSAGLIHRDIKPNNMKLDAEGILKIFDFGLSRNQGANAVTKGFKGTYGFSAPEQFTHSEVSFTSAIDVYAFGATALFLAKLDLPAELKTIPPQPLPPNSFNCDFLNDKPFLISLFEQCLSVAPENRPTIHRIRDELARYLLFEKHQAVAVMDGKVYILNSNLRNAKLNLTGIGSFEIHYNGLWFFLKNVTGEVYVNTVEATSDMKISGACVVALGSSYRGIRERKFITFDISNPEIAL